MSQSTSSMTTTIPVVAVDSEYFYEIVDGHRVEKPPMGPFQVLIAAALDQLLGGFVRANRLGRVAPEMLFKISPTDSPQRRPDVSFVSYARWPRDRKVDSRNGWNVVPKLAIEVISPTNSADEVIDKIVEYFEAGSSSSGSSIRAPARSTFTNLLPG